jgi:hypothetical protein
LSNNENKKKKKDIEEMKNRMPELKRLAFSNYYWALLKQWLTAIGFIIAGVSLGVVLSFIAPPLPNLPLSSSNIQDIAKTIIAPSITTYGFFLTSVPVISFFYIQEIKEEQKQVMASLLEEKKRFTDEEDLKIVNSAYTYSDTFWYNLRIGVLKYVRTYLIVGVSALFSLTYLYFLLSLVNAALFILIDISLMVIILTGIVPIVNVALSKPARKLVRYVISREIVERIELED